MRVAITGATGRLGSALASVFATRADVLAWGRRDLDVTDSAAVRATIARERPDAIVNCTAFNDVDGAETRAVDALAVNALAVRALASAAAASGAALVHYSTDFVFDGTATRPYVEADPAAPQSVYGLSKLLGEWFAAEAPRHFVLRVASLFGGTPRVSRIDAMIDALQEDRPVHAFADRTVTPSFIPDVIEATWAMLRPEAEPGLYHCVGTGVATWDAVAREIARQVGARTSRVIATSAADAPGRAARPRYAALSNAKLARAGVAMPAWQDAVSRHLAARAHDCLL
jgi:dTDP-4-dehydrorhamnose reductase